MPRQAVFTVGLVIGLMGSTAFAQSLNGPAEPPPADFSGNQFVDSQGCAFVRATVNGASSWIARVDQDRNPLCDFEPTFAMAEPSSAESTTVPESEDVADVVDADKDEDEPEVEAADMMDGGAETEVATADETEEATSNEMSDEAMAIDTSAPMARPSPQRVAAAPRRSSPAPTVDAPPRGPISRAEACQGKTGVQPGFISSVTGLPIDCGAGAEVPRLSLAEICARSNGTGVRYINAATGAPVVCDGQVETSVSSVVSSDVSGIARPYIQVGSFGVHSNADRLIQRLGDLGLPVASGRSGALKIVAAGPFTSASAQQQALSTVRGLGFTDAFLRN